VIFIGGKERRAAAIIAWAALALSVAGCTDLVGMALGVKPGDTIDLITASQNQSFSNTPIRTALNYPLPGDLQTSNAANLVSTLLW
jgi:hypothetical protein